LGPVWGLLVCGYGLTERGRPSRPVSGLAGANVANGGPLITVWTRDFLLKAGLKSEFGSVEPDLFVAKSNWAYAVCSDNVRPSLPVPL